MARHESLLLELPEPDAPDSAFEALVAANQRWLGHYARLHPSFGVEAAMLERNSLWMNAFFQKSRIVTPPASPAADALVKKHKQVVLERLRAPAPSHSESEFSTSAVDPMAALMFAASVDRCPESHLEYFLAESYQLVQCGAIKADANRSGFAGCVFRFLSQYSEPEKRILCLRTLVLLAEDDHSATVRACQVAAQGRPWKPNMFILSLQKRHPDNDLIRELATDLLHWFSIDMPIESPVQLDRLASAPGPVGFEQPRARTADSVAAPRSPHKDNALMLPELVKPSPIRPPFSPTTTMSALYSEAPSPYSSTRLPIARPPTSPVEQSRRAVVYSTPKLDAVEGERRRRCQTPYMREDRGEAGAREAHDGGIDSLPGSPLPSPDAESEQKKKVVVSDRYSWNPECINSVSGFEWWWRSLPQNHSSLEPTQKLKAVTKAAVRMHTRGELRKAIELYQLALSADVNAEVEFRLRVNLACAYEAASELPRSIGEFRRAAELNPGDAYAKYKLGDVLVASRRFDEARQLYESILGVYPQAADALVALRRAEEDERQKEIAERAALAAAKASRRFPTKELDAPDGADVKMEATPTPPSTAKSSTRGAAPRSTPTRVQKPTDPSAESPPLAVSVSVGTLTDPADASSSGLGDMLLRRCRELRVDLHACFARMDPLNHGVVRREAIAGVLQILCGVDFGALSDETRQAELKISPEDWDKTDGSCVLLRYAGFLGAHLSKLQAVPSELTDTEAKRVTTLLDELVSGEAGFVPYASEAATGESVPGQHDGPSETDVVRSQSSTEAPRDAPSGESEEKPPSDHEQQQQQQQQLQQPAESSSPRMTLEDRAPSSALLSEATHSARSVLSTIVDGYTGLSPRMDDKRGKAREEQILKAEKARVLSRKHMHCLKSLQDIAARARAHIGARRVARAYLVQVAIDARAQRSALRATGSAASGAVAAPEEAPVGRAHGEAQHSGGDADSIDEGQALLASDEDAARVRAMTASVYLEAKGIAQQRIRCARDVQGVQSLARQYAAEYCRVPAAMEAERSLPPQ